MRCDSWDGVITLHPTLACLNDSASLNGCKSCDGVIMLHPLLACMCGDRVNTLTRYAT